MLIFDKSINKVVSDYICPLSQFGVPFSRLRQDAVKALLMEGPIHIESSNSSEAVFFFNKESLLRAINNDAMLFFVRAMLQRDTAQNLLASYSTNWSIVTDYYYGFYLIGLLLRLCLRGTVYLDDRTKRIIQETIGIFSGKVSTIGNNCYYIAKLDDKENEYTLRLVSSSGLATHELAWDLTNKLLLSFKKESLVGSDERTVLESIEKINKSLGSAYPSILRNKINYHPYYAIKELKNDYSRTVYFQGESNWLYPILTYNGQDGDFDQTKINLVASYICYIQQLSFCLLNKYDSIRGRSSGILSGINKNRERKIVLPESSFVYPIT